jgi:membrane protease YdiL (CAAX protease family)
MTNRIVAGWEIASVIISFLTAEWIIQPSGSSVKMLGVIPLVLGLLTMIVSHYVRIESPPDIGFRFDNFLQAFRKLALPMLVSTSVILIVGWVTGGFQSNKLQIWQWIIWLPLWGFIQQYALQGFINRRAQILSGKGVLSSLIVACVFALLHLPNPWLAVATFAGGFMWAIVYQEVPNLFALGLSHAFMALMLVFALPPSILKSLRVGFRYFS